MGLDIYHFKAVLDPALSNDSQHPIFYADELPPHAFTDFGFDQYVQDVPDTETVHTVEFFADEHSHRHAEARRISDGSDIRTVTSMIGTPESHEQDLRDLERRLGLDPTQSIRYGAGISSLTGPSYHSTHVAYMKPTLRKGIYTTEVGYQRKGMADGFYEYFGELMREYYVFVRSEDFEAVEQSIAPELPESTRAAIHENFTKSYEPGRSILYMSW